MHPDEDISLEELKARKYQHLADRSGPVQFNFSMKPIQQQEEQLQQHQQQQHNQQYNQQGSAPGSFGEFINAFSCNFGTISITWSSGLFQPKFFI
jgi:hypothetical protein